MADPTTERTAVHPHRPVGIRSTPTAAAVPEQMTARYTRPGQLCPRGARSTLPSLQLCPRGARSTLPSLQLCPAGARPMQP